MVDVVLPRRKKCKYGNKILMYHFHRLYIYREKKDFRIKRFYSLRKSIFDVGFGFVFFAPPFFCSMLYSKCSGLAQKRQRIACRCREL